MPNWCNNVVEISHEDPATLKALVEAFNKGEMCDHICPVPEDLKVTASPATQDAELRELYEANTAKHGYANWYDFSIGEWGTKWDVGGSDYDQIELKEGDTQVTLSFDSAWSPPTAIYEKMVELGYQVRAYYYEPGMCYAGIWEDGCDDYYEYSNMDSQQVAEQFPEALNEMFNISESMAEWEEENLEEEE